MIFEDSFTIHAPQALVWEFLNDIPRVGRCMMGLEEVEALSPDEYQGLLKVRVGSVGVAFKGKVTITERSGGSKFAARVEARDPASGSNVSTTFIANLSQEGEDTRIHYSMDMVLRGRLAGYGQAVIQGTARNMTADFARCLQDTLSVTRRIVVWGMDFADLAVEHEILAGLDVALEQVAAEPDDAGWETLAAAHILLAAPAIELSGEVLRRLTRCEAVVCYARSADQVYLRVATQRGIRVAALEAYDAPERAFHTLALILAAVRRLPELQRLAADGEGELPELHRPSALTLGLLGWDATARLVWKQAAALGFQVLVSDPAGCIPAGNTPDENLGDDSPARLDLVPDSELYKRSDVIALFGEVTAQTFQVINARSLKLARPGVVLVNTSYPRLVDTTALEQALRSRQVSLAALDSFDYFEAGLSRSWLEGTRLLLTPHASGASQEAVLEQRRLAALAAAGFAGRGMPPALANPEVSQPAQAAQVAPSLRWSD